MYTSAQGIQMDFKYLFTYMKLILEEKRKRKEEGMERSEREPEFLTWAIFCYIARHLGSKLHHKWRNGHSYGMLMLYAVAVT